MSKSSSSQARRVAPSLKSQILNEILSSNLSIPVIAKKYDISSTTLYGWRIEYVKKMTANFKSCNLESKNTELDNNFIELLPESNDDLSGSNSVDLDKLDDFNSNKSVDIGQSNNFCDKSSNLRLLSPINLTFSNNLSISISSNISISKLSAILNAIDCSC